jgi:release factor glutamine methyltransferase
MTTQHAFDDLIRDLTPLLGEGEARSVSRIVLEDAFSWRRSQRPREMGPEEVRRWESIRERLLAGEPVQYILGEADFFGLKFLVNPAVLIPRPETEELVEWIIDEAKESRARHEELRLLDIGTGSGCIALAVKHQLPAIAVTGWDISESALQIARKNAERLQLAVEWRQRDILQENGGAGEEEWEVIVSNPPYIPPSEKKLMPRQVLDHEPSLALFVEEEDPLLFYRAIFAYAQRHLASRGTLFFELNEHHARAVAELGRQFDITGTLRQDLQGKWRMFRGKRI